jgi:hypothetical protein
LLILSTNSKNSLQKQRNEPQTKSPQRICFEG